MANAVNIKIVRKVDKDGNAESLESMLRRFKKAYQESGILAELRKHEYARSKGQKVAEKKKRAADLRRREEIRQSKYYNPKED